MISNWLTVSPCLPARSSCREAIQLQLSRNHRLSEIACADEIWDHANLRDRLRIKQKQCIPQARLLLPERAFHICKNLPTPNLCGVRQRRRAGILIHGRAVGNDEKRGFIFRSHADDKTSNAERATSNA